MGLGVAQLPYLQGMPTNPTLNRTLWKVMPMPSKPRRMSRLRQRLPESLAWLEEAGGGGGFGVIVDVVGPCGFGWIWLKSVVIDCNCSHYNTLKPQ